MSLSDSAADAIMPHVFQVVDSGDDLELDIPPTSGIEYLRRVQKEAKHCPDVVVADIDIKAFDELQTVRVKEGNGLSPAPAGMAPSRQWQQKQIAEFADVRQKLARYKAKQKRKDVQVTGPKLPNKEDVQKWCSLCFGEMQVSASSREQRVPSLQSTGGSPPLLSIITQMNQPTIAKVLEYHINWFEATGFSHEQGQWFYALLVSLEKPLDPESCSLIRSLTRNCANYRAALPGLEHPHARPLNLLICFVARYFNQTDLADDR